MKKMVIILFILCLNVFSVVGCSSKQKAPELTISVKGKEIPYTVEKLEDNEVDREDTEEQLTKNLIENEEIPYIKIGEIITIQFGKKYPDQIVVKDCLLNKDGTRKYSENLTRETQLELKEDTLQYELTPHIATGLSSDRNDYLDGNVVRGVSFVYDRDGEEYEYTFVIKTDAK